MRQPLIILLFLITSLLAIPAVAEDDSPVAPAVIYYNIPEPFTINFLNQSQKKARYLQIKVALMARDQVIIDSAELNLPMIQDALRSLFSSQTMDSIATVEARMTLQTATLEAIKAILKEETGNDNIENVYFTSFILQ